MATARSKKAKAETFADRLAALVEASGQSKAAIAAAAGMSRMNLHHLLNGADPKWSVVQALAEALGVSTEELRAAGKQAG